MAWISIGSTSARPIVKRGFRLAYGFWNTTWMRRRIGWRSRSESFRMSRPSKITSPPVGSCSRSSDKPIVVLPDPDSPTTPSVWPRLSSKLTSCTALNSRLPNSPCLMKKLLASARTCSTTGDRGSLGLATARLASAVGAPAAPAAMWSSITISRAGFSLRLGRQASSALV